MNLFRLILLFAAAMLLVGCQQNGQPTTQPVNVEQLVLTGANTSFTLAENTATDLREGGLIGDTDWKHTQEIAATLRTALDTWQANLGQPAGNEAKAVFFSTLPQILQIVHDFNPARKPPTTQPMVHHAYYDGYQSYHLRTLRNAHGHSGRATPLVPVREAFWLKAG